MNDSLTLPIALYALNAQMFALRVALGGAGICAVVLLAARVLRRRSEPLRYGILFGGVIALLAMPALIGVGQSLAMLLPAGAPVEDEIMKIPAESLPDLLSRPLVEPPPADVESATISGEAVGNALLMLWILGVTLGLCRLLYALWKQNRMILGALWQADVWTDEWRAELAQKLGRRQFPQVYLSPAAPMPMVVRILNPVIVLPEQGPSTWERFQLEAVLLHEAAHIARHDPWAVLAQRVAAILFWWCPLVHLVGRRLNDLREQICDDYALEGTCDRIAYAELLVETAERLLRLKLPPVPVGLLDSARGGLETRVIRVLEKEKRPMIKLSLPGRLFPVGILVVACTLILASTAFSGGQAQPQKKIQIRIIVDGKEIDLSDPRLLEHIEAAQKKAKAGPAFKIVGAIQAAPAKPATPATPGRVVKGIAFSPDGRLVFELGPVQAKADPRIEELVLQAEKIKPGSGADIRRALQGAAKQGQVFEMRLESAPKKAADKTVKPSPGIRFWDGATGKKVIILTIQDGKVIEVHEKDAQKLLGPGLRFNLDRDVVKKAKDKKTDPKSGVEFTLPIEGSTATASKPAPTPTPADIDQLRRQLERLSADLNELRKRLDAGKK